MTGLPDTRGAAGPGRTVAVIAGHGSGPEVLAAARDLGVAATSGPFTRAVLARL